MFYRCNIRGVIYAVNESGCIEVLKEKFFMNIKRLHLLSNSLFVIQTCFYRKSQFSLCVISAVSEVGLKI